MNEQHEAYLLGLAMGKLNSLMTDVDQIIEINSYDLLPKLEEINNILTEMASKYYKKPEAPLFERIEDDV